MKSDIPKFLRRKCTAASREAVDAMIKREQTGGRAWAPMRSKVPPRAPMPLMTDHPDLMVKVQVKEPHKAGSTLLATYANMAEFEAKHDKSSYPVKGHPMLFQGHNVVLVTAKPWAGKEKVAPGPKASRVVVNKIEYDSVLAAFEALLLPVSKHQKFRAELKAKRKLVFVHELKKYAFSYPKEER